MRFGARRLGLAAALVAGCGPKVGVEDAGDDGSTTTSGTTAATEVGEAEVGEVGPGESGVADTGDPTGVDPTQRAVDVLFVIDNSGTMGEEQTRLVAGIGDFVAALDAYGIDWRIGITTTDNGNPWCSGTTPEGGALRLTSCRSRTQEFVFNGAMMVDVTQEACLDRCLYDSIDVLPTTTDVDPQAVPRPWLQSVAGVTNVSPDVGVLDALACFLPQGINGCGFEQPLESMYKGVARTENADESSYGFIRAGGLLAVIIVTDETDCSHNADWSDIFLPTENGGNEVFWSDPDNQTSPTSAVCWNAGVACTGNASLYIECHAENKDIDGLPLPEELADGDAVLHPLQRYPERLSAYPSYVAAIDGVPPGYAEGLADMAYQDSIDPQISIDFGIGPECESVGGLAVPSVRVREVVESMSGGERNDFSICDADYDDALQTIAQRIQSRLP
jgi:hypothetical protein